MRSGRPILVYLAQPRGVCAGVVGVIEIVERVLEKHGSPVDGRHEIGHNNDVVERLKHDGAILVEDLSEVPPLAVSAFSAHGVTPSVEEETAARALPVENATCALVTKVHNQGKRCMSKGRALWVQNVGDVAAFSPPPQMPAGFVKARFTDIQGPDIRDICYARNNHQAAVGDQSTRGDMMLVVGAADSSNSNQLCEIGTEAGVPSYLIAGGSEPKEDWLKDAKAVGVKAVGVTAGAFGCEVLVDDVIGALPDLGPLTVSALPGDNENIELRLPAELAAS